MKCSECQELVYEYTDSTLPEDTRREIESHVATCHSCRALFEQEQALLVNISGTLDKSVSTLKIDSAMRRNILEAAENETGNVIQFNSRPIWLAAAAAIMITSLAALKLHTPASSAPHVSSSIQTIATVYADSSKTYWTKRTLLMKKNNGSESFLQIVATRPQRIQTITRKQGDRT